MSVIIATDLAKTFTMHLQGGQELPVIKNASFTVDPGELVVLGGASGSGKSSIMKMIYGNYAITSGSIQIAHDGDIIDMATASPRLVTRVRARSLGYVSQFLRVVPRVPARTIVAEPLLEWGVDEAEALERAEVMLTRLNVPQTLWNLPPATFSGGEQQRVNIARGLISQHPILLLDEPTASLDATNRGAVIELIEAKREAGVAMLGIFHDADTRARVATRVVDVEVFRPAQADEAA